MRAACIFRHIQLPPVHGILSLSEWEVVTIISSEVIGARIRELRREKELTQQELAEFCSFPGSWKISGLESGRKGSGIERPDTLEIVCRELGIELWELLKPDPPLPKSTTADNIEALREIVVKAE